MNNADILELLLRKAYLWLTRFPGHNRHGFETIAYTMGVRDTLQAMGRPALAEEASDALALYFNPPPTQEPKP